MIVSGRTYFDQWRSDRSFDLLVVGGGITGVGAALDAASRGLRVLLVEQDDLASHSSSRSSKLIHGGLRYLEQFDFSLVRKSLEEQHILLETLAPYHVTPLRFTMPLEGRGLKALYFRLGTLLYDWLVGRRGDRKSKSLEADAVQKALPALHPRYRAGISYEDAVMDDVRLVFSVAHKASEKGATLLTRTRAVFMTRDTGDGQPSGQKITLDVGGRPEVIAAKEVILAVGAFGEALQSGFGKAPVTLTAAKGSHILIAREQLGGTSAIVTKTKNSVLFCIPFRHHWVIGTTDTPLKPGEDGEKPTEAEILYLLEEINQHLATPLKRTDVIGAYAGVRPLVGAGKTSKISRDHSVTRTEKGAVLVVGGKYTTYRLMAEDAVNEAFKDTGSNTGSTMGSSVGSTKGVGGTKALPLWGAEGWRSEQDAIDDLTDDFPVAFASAQRLVQRYGLKAKEILAGTQDIEDHCCPIFPDGPLWAELVFGIRKEAAGDLVDLLHRRVRLDLEREDAGLLIAPALLDHLQNLGLFDDLVPKTALKDFAKAVTVIRGQVDASAFFAEKHAAE